MDDLMGILGIACCFLRKTMLKRTWKSAMHEGGRFDCSLNGKSKLPCSGVSSPRSAARADATAASLSRKACIRGLPTHQDLVDLSLACAVSFGTAPTPLLRPAEADRKQHHLNHFAWQHKQRRGSDQMIVIHGSEESKAVDVVHGLQPVAELLVPYLIRQRFSKLFPLLQVTKYLFNFLGHIHKAWRYKVGRKVPPYAWMYTVVLNIGRVCGLRLQLDQGVSITCTDKAVPPIRD
jgi:hypothetical protein